jgi:hypothetical protein
LYRCVALFEMCERLKAPSRWRHLGASHLRLVIGLSPQAQERVLATANDQRWTVKALQQALDREKPTRLTTGGRRAGSPLTHSLKHLRQCLERHRSLLEQLEAIPSETLAHTTQLLDDARQSMEQLALALLTREGKGGPSLQVVY